MNEFNSVLGTILGVEDTTGIRWGKCPFWFTINKSINK